MNNLTLPDSASPDQIEAAQIIDEGGHCLITGPGGTGKSWLIDQIVEQLEHVALTASTGIAAVNIGGRTIHSWSGMGLAQATADELIAKIKYQKYMEATRERIEATRHLIIDEVSMLGANLFEKLDQVLRVVKDNPEPFGGIQLIMFGDFLQLPPVKDEFVFTSPIWGFMLPKVKVLTTIHRQKDKEFSELLMRLRIGRHTQADMRFLESLQSNKLEGKPLILHSHNDNVDRFNQKELDALDTNLFTYEASDTGDDKNALQQLDKNCLSPFELQLKVGARVMLTKNLSASLANGTCGTITKLEKKKVHVKWDSYDFSMELDKGEWEVTDTATREVLARRKQYPLRLAWAVTIHKSQGMTLQEANVFLGQCFAPGQVYVALSRMSNTEYLRLSSFKPTLIKTDRTALAFYNNPMEPSKWCKMDKVMNVDPLGL